LSSTITYLSVTMSSIVHTMRERMPSTASVPAAPWAVAAVTASRIAYSGLVPMSPKTTPIEPNASAQNCRL
jgi:hypothetical protein